MSDDREREHHGHAPHEDAHDVHDATRHGAAIRGATSHGAASRSAMDGDAMVHGAVDHAGMDHAGMDHAGTGHADTGHAGHGDHAGQFRRLFWIMLALAVPTVALSSMFAMILGYPLPEVPGLAWVSPILGTVMYAWGGRPFLSGAVGEIRARRPGMMLLIALAITVAFVASWGASLGLIHHELDFWWELALLIVIMLLGHWVEMRALAQTATALGSLAALLPDVAERVEPDEAPAANDAAGDATAERIVEVSPADLVVGDVVLVRPGGSVPADGRIVDGRASMDESMITGESQPVTRGTGDAVTAGTVATDSGLRVEVTATGDATALAGIQQLVAQAQSSSSRAQRLADTAAGWLFWFALGAAVLTAIVWVLVGRPDDAVIRTITVLVIACPHALGLAIPLVVSIATERAARGGVLVKDRLALESMRTVDAVLFDKTGTLTRGEPVVERIALADAAPGAGSGAVIDEDRLLALAAAAEAGSEHPLARAIVAAARDRGVAVPAARDFGSSPAVGVTATIEGAEIRVGGPHLLAEEGVAELREVEAWRSAGAIILHVLRNGAVIGALGLADGIRPESRDAVAALHRQGVEVVMITGDAEAVAASVAQELGIARWFAGVRPEHKAAKVRELQAEGRRVAMVGDGVNDAPALAQADVGLAIGAGTDVAIASAGVILAGDDPRAVLSVVELSRAAYRKMKQNLWWAAGYNLISVPLAAGVLAPVGFVLPMSVGAILMSLSTIVVALNAQFLRRLDLRPQTVTAAILGSRRS